MSTKFNNLGQWSLGSDGGGSALIKGIKSTGSPVSSRTDKHDGAKGADVAKLAVAQIVAGQLPEIGPRIKLQPTNEELFGGMVVTEEMAKAAENNWNNTFNKHFADFNKPIDHLNKSKVEGEWGCGTSFNQLLKGQLTEEELAARNNAVTQE